MLNLQLLAESITDTCIFASDGTVTAAISAYVTYHASQTSSHYDTFKTAAQAAAGLNPTTGGLTTVLSDLNTLLGSTYSAYTTETTALANDIVNSQSSLKASSTQTVSAVTDKLLPIISNELYSVINHM
jgi:hypothetical protein